METVHELAASFGFSLRFVRGLKVDRNWLVEVSGLDKRAILFASFNG